MGSKILKISFVSIWMFLFFVLLFDHGIRLRMLAFCELHYYMAPAILIVSQITLASLALPCSPLTMLAGMLWGVALGIVYSTVATVLSSIWTFLFGRYVVGFFVKTKINFPWWEKISGLIHKHGWKAAAIAHANPIFPGSSLGYAFGASRIKFVEFLVGAFIGTVPLQLATVGLGSAIRQAMGGAGEIAVILAFVLVLVIMIYLKVAPIIFNKVEKEDAGDEN